MEISWKGTVSAVSGNSPETTRKLCLSTKFIYQEIRWNYDIFRSVKQWLLLGVAIVQYLSGNTHMGQGIKEWTKQNLWKTAFKKLEVISSVLYSINFLGPFLNTTTHITNVKRTNDYAILRLSKKKDILH